MPQARELSEKLLGRAEPLARLEEALDDAGRGRGQLAVVSGEAGIGKSALVEEVSRRAESRGFAAATGRAWEFADAPPWFAVRACLASLGIDPRRIAEETEHGTFVLWEHVLETLAITTRERPMLWVVEDVHAADLQTLDLLVFLTRPLRTLHALVVVTTRPDDPRLSERMAERLTRMARDGIDLRLRALDTETVASLVTRIAGVELQAVYLKQLFELSAGNPLFIVEYARALAGSRNPEAALSSLPATLRHVVLERARFLPEPTRAVLDAGSVMGRDFSAATLAEVLKILPAQVIDRLISALRSGLVTESAPGQFRFSHVLVRDAFYEAMELSRRSSFHAAAAAAFSASHSNDALISAAQHALRGLPLSEPGHTVQLVDRAVRMLEAQGAPDRAFSLRKELDAARKSGLLPAPDPEVYLDSARLARAAGRFGDARELCSEVLARARADSNPNLLAEAALALGAALQPGMVDANLVAALKEARAGLKSTESKLGCLVHARLAAALQPAPDPEEPMRMARAAIEDARRWGDPVLLREVLFFAGSALVDFAPPDERMAAAKELFELSEQTGDRERALHASVRLSMEYAASGDFMAFSDSVDTALRISDELGRAPRHRFRPLLLSSMRASACGRFDESEQAIIEVQELASHCDDPALSMALASHRLLTLRLRRRDDEVNAMVAELNTLMKASPLSGPMGAMLRLTIAARTEDLEATRRALAAVEPYVERFASDPDFCMLIAEGVALAGSEALRRRIRGLIERGSPELGMGHIMMVYEGPARRVVALLDASLGELSSALEQLRASRELAVARGHRLWVMQIDYDLGRVLDENGRGLEAREYLERAAELAMELGVLPVLHAARRRLGGLAPAAPEPVASPPGLELVPRGDSWELRYRGRVFSIRDMRGMLLLSRLVERPGEEIHALALGGLETVDGSDAGELLDETARRAYQGRLVDLESALDEAETTGDRGRIEVVKRERDALVSELSRAVGLGGRLRKAGSATERARVNVRKRIKQAILRIEQVDAEAGRYLSQAVRTGTFCSFRP